MTFCREVFKGIRGEYSSKRAVTIFAFILIAAAFIADLFWDVKLEQFMYDNMTYIVIAGLGLTAAEPIAHLLKKKSSGFDSYEQ